MRYFLILFGVLFFGLNPLFGTPSVVFNGDSTRVSILSKNESPYMTLRDVANLTKGTVFYKRKHGVYLLLDTDQKEIASFSKLSSAVTFKQAPLTLSPPVLYERGRVYVPLSFFKTLGYSVTETPKEINIYSSNTPPKHTLTQTPSPQVSQAPPKHISSTKKASVSAENSRLSVNDPASLRFNAGISASLTGKIFYQDDTLMVWVSDVLSQLGYTSAQQDNQLVFSKASARVSFVVGQDGAILKNGQLYAPLSVLLGAMGYQVQISPQTNTIYALTPIDSIRYANTQNSPKISILSKGAITHNKPQGLAFGRGYYLTLPFTDSRHLNDISVQDPHIRRIEISQKGPDTLLKIVSKKRLQYPHIQENGNAYDILFNTQLTKLSFEGSALILQATGHVEPEGHVFQNPPRYVIDFENTLNGLNTELESASPYIDKIRTSQYKTDPPVTRVVIDLKPGYEAILSQDTASRVIVTFPPSNGVPPREEVASTKPPKRASRPRSTLSSLSPDVSLSQSISGKVIVIDPGHGGRDPGAVVGKEVFEKNFTLDISTKLAKRLRKQGASVILTRSRDRDISLSHRALIGNRNKADAFVSIHINSFIKPHANGTETYYYKTKDRALAHYIQTQLKRDLNLPSNGVKRARLYVLRHTKMPAALVEPLFLTNSDELALLRSASYRDKIAESIETALLSYFASEEYKRSKH